MAALDRCKKCQALSKSISAERKVFSRKVTVIEALKELLHTKHDVYLYGIKQMVRDLKLQLDSEKSEIRNQLILAINTSKKLFDERHEFKEKLSTTQKELANYQFLTVQGTAQIKSLEAEISSLKLKLLDSRKKKRKKGGIESVLDWTEKIIVKTESVASPDEGLELSDGISSLGSPFSEVSYESADKFLKPSRHLNSLDLCDKCVKIIKTHHICERNFQEMGFTSSWPVTPSITSSRASTPTRDLVFSDNLVELNLTEVKAEQPKSLSKTRRKIKEEIELEDNEEITKVLENNIPDIQILSPASSDLSLDQEFPTNKLVIEFKKNEILGQPLENGSVNVIPEEGNSLTEDVNAALLDMPQIGDFDSFIEKRLIENSFSNNEDFNFSSLDNSLVIINCEGGVSTPSMNERNIPVTFTSSSNSLPVLKDTIPCLTTSQVPSGVSSLVSTTQSFLNKTPNTIDKLCDKTTNENSNKNISLSDGILVLKDKILPFLDTEIQQSSLLISDERNHDQDFFEEKNRQQEELISQEQTNDYLNSYEELHSNSKGSSACGEEFRKDPDSSPDLSESKSGNSLSGLLNDEVVLKYNSHESPTKSCKRISRCSTEKSFCADDRGKSNLNNSTSCNNTTVLSNKVNKPLDVPETNKNLLEVRSDLYISSSSESEECDQKVLRTISSSETPSPGKESNLRIPTFDFECSLLTESLQVEASDIMCRKRKTSTDISTGCLSPDIVSKIKNEMTETYDLISPLKSSKKIQLDTDNHEAKRKRIDTSVNLETIKDEIKIEDEDGNVDDYLDIMPLSSRLKLFKRETFIYNKCAEIENVVKEEDTTTSFEPVSNECDELLEDSHFNDSKKTNLERYNCLRSPKFDELIDSQPQEDKTFELSQILTDNLSVNPDSTDLRMSYSKVKKCLMALQSNQSIESCSKRECTLKGTGVLNNRSLENSGSKHLEEDNSVESNFCSQLNTPSDKSLKETCVFQPAQISSDLLLVSNDNLVNDVPTKMDTTDSEFTLKCTSKNKCDSYSNNEVNCILQEMLYLPFPLSPLPDLMKMKFDNHTISPSSIQTPCKPEIFTNRRLVDYSSDSSENSEGIQSNLFVDNLNDQSVEPESHSDQIGGSYFKEIKMKSVIQEKQNSKAKLSMCKSPKAFPLKVINENRSTKVNEMVTMVQAPSPEFKPPNYLAPKSRKSKKRRHLLEPKIWMERKAVDSAPAVVFEGKMEIDDDEFLSFVNGLYHKFPILSPLSDLDSSHDGHINQIGENNSYRQTSDECTNQSCEGFLSEASITEKYSANVETSELSSLTIKEYNDESEDCVSQPIGNCSNIGNVFTQENICKENIVNKIFDKGTSDVHEVFVLPKESENEILLQVSSKFGESGKENKMKTDKVDTLTNDYEKDNSDLLSVEIGQNNPKISVVNTVEAQNFCEEETGDIGVKIENVEDSTIDTESSVKNNNLENNLNIENPSLIETKFINSDKNYLESPLSPDVLSDSSEESFTLHINLDKECLDIDSRKIEVEKDQNEHENSIECIKQFNQSLNPDKVTQIICHYKSDLCLDLDKKDIIKFYSRKKNKPRKILSQPKPRNGIRFSSNRKFELPSKVKKKTNISTSYDDICLPSLIREIKRISLSRLTKDNLYSNEKQNISYTINSLRDRNSFNNGEYPLLFEDLIDSQTLFNHDISSCWKKHKESCAEDLLTQQPIVCNQSQSDSNCVLDHSVLNNKDISKLGEYDNGIVLLNCSPDKDINCKAKICDISYKSSIYKKFKLFGNGKGIDTFHSAKSSDKEDMEMNLIINNIDSQTVDKNIIDIDCVDNNRSNRWEEMMELKISIPESMTNNDSATSEGNSKSSNLLACHSSMACFGKLVSLQCGGNKATSRIPNLVNGLSNIKHCKYLPFDSNLSSKYMLNLSNLKSTNLHFCDTTTSANNATDNAQLTNGHHVGELLNTTDNHMILDFGKESPRRQETAVTSENNTCLSNSSVISPNDNSAAVNKENGHVLEIPKAVKFNFYTEVSEIEMPSETYFGNNVSENSVIEIDNNSSEDVPTKRKYPDTWNIVRTQVKPSRLESEMISCKTNAFECSLDYWHDYARLNPKPKTANLITNKDLQVLESCIMEIINATAEDNLIEKIHAMGAKIEHMDSAHIADILVDAVYIDNGEPDLRFTPPAPPLTPLQRRLLLLLSFLAKGREEYYLTVLKAFEELVVSFVDKYCIMNLSNLVQFHTALCRHLGLLSRSRAFLYDILYCKGLKTYPLVFSMLPLWIEILPSSQDAQDCLLTQTFVYILTNYVPHQKSDIAPFHSSLKQFLDDVYDFSGLALTKDILCNKLIDNIRVPGAGLALVLLCKREEWEWASKTMENKVHPIISSWIQDQVDEDTATQAVLCLGRVVRGYPMNVASNSIKRSRDLLESVLNHQKSIDVTEAAVASICMLRRHDLFSCSIIFTTWRPSEGKITKNMADNIKTVLSAKQLTYWKKFLSRYN